MKGAKKKKAKARNKALWQKEILDSGYSVQVFSDIHWRLEAFGVSFDLWPTTGTWKEDGGVKSKGLEAFRDRIERLESEQQEMNDLDQRFNQLVK